MMKSILIIEDDITFGMMLKTWLSKKGFEVSSVSNIARAQKHIEGQGADLILSDLRLPDHDGIDLLKWMNEKGIDIPLIIMTGYADIQSAVQAMKLGARDYVAKPVNPEELLKKMSEALQAKEAPTTHTAAKTSAKKGSSISSGNATETHHAYLEGESDAAKQLYNYVGLDSHLPSSSKKTDSSLLLKAALPEENSPARRYVLAYTALFESARPPGKPALL